MTKARRVTAALAVAAAVLVIVGSALPLFSVTFLMGAGPVEFTMTAWGIESDGGIFPIGDVPANGFPLVFAGVLMAFAAGALRAAARPGALARTERVGVLAVVAGGAFLACAVWMVAAQSVNWEDTYGPPDDAEDLSFGGETGYGAGLWILVLAALLGVAAAVLAQLPGPRPAPVVTADPDAPTPPFGIVLPVQAEEPRPELPEPEPEPAPVPVLGPIVIPEAPPPPAPAGPAVPLVEDPLDEPRRD
jgi:hypothetical protein